MATDAVAGADHLVAVDEADNGHVAMLFETPSPGHHLARRAVRVVAGRGAEGDHPRKSFYLGRYVHGREISACQREVLSALGIDPQVVGDNLITEGIDLAALPAGARLGIGPVVLARSVREHRPCALFAERTSQAAYATVREHGRRGALFVVHRGGVIRVGDAIRRLRR